jgi:tRNA1Val (adenine37-N6)-methyltransferase
MFQFKQFTIHQNQTAMKVCTDACVLGAWTSADRVLLPNAGPTILDIGTGTGLLALMAAQNHPTAWVDAVEIDPDAFVQATENRRNSPFANRIQVHKTAIQEFRPGYAYDLILTNPPFFTNHLRSPDAATNRALHTDTLPFADLVTGIDRLLKPTGQWWVLLPPYEAGLLDQLAAPLGLHPVEQLLLRHNPRKAPFRHITGYRRDDISFSEMSSLTTHALTIYEPDGTNPTREQYTDAFRQLLRPFYLIF